MTQVTELNLTELEQRRAALSLDVAEGRADVSDLEAIEQLLFRLRTEGERELLASQERERRKEEEERERRAAQLKADKAELAKTLEERDGITKEFEKVVEKLCGIVEKLERNGKTIQNLSITTGFTPNVASRSGVFVKWLLFRLGRSGWRIDFVEEAFRKPPSTIPNHREVLSAKEN